MKIEQVVIPAAGLGTRFLPFTKAVAKELLPLLNKPAIQQIVEEALASAAPEIILILNEEKKALRSYFEPNPQIENQIDQACKQERLFELRQLIKRCSFTYLTQTTARGLGHALTLAEEKITAKENTFFAVMLPDDIIVAPDLPALAQLKAIAQTYNASVVAVQEVPEASVSSYGIVDPGTQLNERTYQINTMIEKPAPGQAPSRLAIVGRYIFDPVIFSYLKSEQTGIEAEVQLTDAIARMIADGYPVVAYQFEGKRFDLGTPPGWLEANIFFAHQNPLFARIFSKI